MGLLTGKKVTVSQGGPRAIQARAHGSVGPKTGGDETMVVQGDKARLGRTVEAA